MDKFGAAFIQSIDETSHFDSSIRGIAQTWLAVCPHTYFSELFLEKQNWNGPFLRAFDQSDMVEAQACFQITQAYYLTNLFRIMSNDKNYKKYSKETIQNDVESHIKSGSKLLDLSSEFEKKIGNASTVEEIPICYVDKLLQLQYPDKESFDSILSSIWINSESMFGLTIFYTESMKRAKYIDAQG